MKRNSFLIAIITATGLAACDPAHRLIIINESAEARRIEAVNAQRDRFDSGLLALSAGKAWSYPLDSTALSRLPVTLMATEPERRYAFVLPAAQSVLIESALGPWPNVRQIIINGSDTLVVRKSRRLERKHHRLQIGGDFLLRL